MLKLPMPRTLGIYIYNAVTAQRTVWSLSTGKRHSWSNVGLENVLNHKIGISLTTMPQRMLYVCS